MWFDPVRWIPHSNEAAYPQLQVYLHLAASSGLLSCYVVVPRSASFHWPSADWASLRQVIRRKERLSPVSIDQVTKACHTSVVLKGFIFPYEVCFLYFLLFAMAYQLLNFIKPKQDANKGTISVQLSGYKNFYSDLTKIAFLGTKGTRKKLAWL